MIRGATVSNEPDTIEIEDEIADFTADLLSLKAYESVLKAILTQIPGVWADLANFIANDHPAAQEADRLQAGCNGQLKVTWLEHPELDSGYCLILFYVDALNWNSIAVYNKARLHNSL